MATNDVVFGASGPPLNNDFFPGFRPFPGFGSAPPGVASESDTGSTELVSDAGHTHVAPIKYIDVAENSIQSNRSAQSISNSTRPGVTNFGSRSSGGNTGTFSFYGTNGGGDLNLINAIAPYGVISGGLAAVISREGQAARASGRFLNQGDAQISDIILSATSVGGVVTELESLAMGTFGVRQFTIEVRKTYQIVINAVATRTAVNEAGTKCASTTQKLLVRRATGGAVQILTGAVPTAFTQDPEATGWLLLVDAAAGPDRVRLRIDPNGDLATIRIVSNISWIEVGKLDS